MEPQAPGGGEVKLEQLDDLNLDIDNINDLVVEAVLGEAFGMEAEVTHAPPPPMQNTQVTATVLPAEPVAPFGTSAPYPVDPGHRLRFSEPLTPPPQVHQTRHT